MEERFKTFTTLITDISRKIRKIKNEEIEIFNLKAPHVSCIYYLYINGDMTSKELTDLTDEDKANVSRSIEYLEKNGFITCNSDTQKRYRAPLLLTEKGKEVGEYIVNKVDTYLEKASRGITEEMRINMYDSLILISKNLDTISD